ncbi:pyridoxal-phosphate dependent enzyme [Durotheca rogersii]|uniref:pyridoxal-phosphate dependent enzyme n=1 Tax=Durotheca rogersii TaxID=419775 RepID=UPI00221F4C31|nr:pyridoxal-phosphate dependent enzyme [Durotheca rogersii]KAI5867297.1 pyridoxal-phosphate dependent enzyme [Durotheca rogersii]
MGSYEPEPQELYTETPCIRSAALSQAIGCNVFLKLENLQPAGSFKSRGIGHMMRAAAGARPDARFYCSSGGNAGLACATAAAALRRPCTVVVPLTTPAHMIDKIRALGAQVHQVGAHWERADAHLRAELLARDPAGVYVPPFDHADIWAGVSTLVDELAADAPAPDAILCNCGGGGLLNGVMEGVERNYGAASAPEPADEDEGKDEGAGRRLRAAGGKRPTVVVAETRGAESLHASLAAGRLVALPAITSVATSLGAPRVSERTFRWATEEYDYYDDDDDGRRQQRQRQRRKLVSVVVTDAEAVAAAARFADDARMLVEVACGATLAVAYSGELRRLLAAEEGRGHEGFGDEEWARKNVVVIVCGGSNISLDLLRAYQEKFGLKTGPGQ